MSTELKPCPFCGGRELRLRRVGSFVPGMPEPPMRVGCAAADCEDVCGPVGYGRHEAADAWNRRAPDASLSQEVERLKAERHAALSAAEMASTSGGFWAKRAEAAEAESGRLTAERDAAQAFISDLVHMQSNAGWTRAAIRTAAKEFLDAAGKKPVAPKDTTPAFVLLAEVVAERDAALERVKALEADRTVLAKALERANDRVGGIEVPAMSGDNLAVTLCSHFDDGEGEVEDETGWSPAAVEGCEQTIRAIQEHYITALSALSHKEG